MPLAEHDLPVSVSHNTTQSFNSRAPRGARPEYSCKPNPNNRFNSRAPRGARLGYTIPYLSQTYVSIHVPLAEHDVAVAKYLLRPDSFNSRAPRGARPNAISLYVYM